MQRIMLYNYMYLVPLLISTVAGLKSFKLAAYQRYQLFSVLLLGTLFVEVFAIAWKWYLHGGYSISNLWVYNSFLPIRLWLLLAFYKKVLTGAKIKKFLNVSLPFFVIALFINCIFGQGFHAINSYSIILMHILFIIVSVAYFVQIFRDPVPVDLAHEPLFWISLGTCIYYSASLPFFSFLKVLTEHYPAVAISFFYINVTLNAITYTLYLISFICKPHYIK